MLSGQDLLEVLRPIVQEFFEHGDTKEVLVSATVLSTFENVCLVTLPVVVIHVINLTDTEVGTVPRNIEH